MTVFPEQANGLGRKERVSRINAILRVCRKNRWTDYTPNIAGRIEAILAPAGFTKRTVRDYTRAIVGLLAIERKKPSRLKTRSPRREDDTIEDALVERHLKSIKE